MSVENASRWFNVMGIFPENPRLMTILDCICMCVCMYSYNFIYLFIYLFVSNCNYYHFCWPVSPLRE